ncbi:MAG: helix-turn-helix domain-containing protein [Pseudomonadota bacterium]
MTTKSDLKKFAVVSSDIGKLETTFRDVLMTICTERRLSQFQIAAITDYSEATISRILNGSRPLTQKFAEKLAEALGGSSDLWLEVYEQTSQPKGSKKSVGYFTNLLFGIMDDEGIPGSRIRRMRRSDIIQIFSNSEGMMEFRGASEDCEIYPFDKDSVEETSYDTHVGGYYYEDRPKIDSVEEANNGVIIPAGEARMIITREHITLPSWLEASLSPAWSIGSKGLFVAHGPIIDPGKWSGRLHVNVFNPTKRDISISKDEPFITLRFEMQDYKFV